MKKKFRTLAFWFVSASLITCMIFFLMGMKEKINEWEKIQIKLKERSTRAAERKDNEFRRQISSLRKNQHP